MPPILRIPVAILALLCSTTPLFAQTFGKMERDRGHIMLRTIRDEIRKSYYDPAFRGIDLDARFAKADQQIDQATSNSQVFGIIAQALLDFDDSHLFFVPPSRANRVEYGWRYQAIGDKCYVIAVKPKSDAEAKGLAVGDQILAIDGFGADRATAWKLHYLYNALRPRPGMRLDLQRVDGKEQQLDVMASVQQGHERVDLTTDRDFWSLVREMEANDRLHRHRYHELEDALLWKMPQFDLEAQDLRAMMKRAGKHKALILDLRGNAGGSVETLQKLLGSFFDHDVTIAEIRGRKETKPMTAKSWGSGAYDGKLVVLIDSGSGSSAEVLARVIQLEKRGTVIGDRSAGAVMQSRHVPFQLGADVVVPYGLSVTNADVIMSDGKSLEHVGVTPDELLLPTAADLAAGRDPVLARAAELVGLKLDAVKAGTLFPIEWPK